MEHSPQPCSCDGGVKGLSRQVADHLRQHVSRALAPRLPGACYTQQLHVVKHAHIDIHCTIKIVFIG